MTYYSVLDVTPTSEDWIPDYLPAANARVAAHGGRYIARTANHEQVEGSPQEAGCVSSSNGHPKTPQRPLWRTTNMRRTSWNGPKALSAITT